MSVISFGCRLNAYESEVMQGILDKSPAQDICIINTCAVTLEAERQAKQEIRRINRDDPHKKIIVTGCASHINPSLYAELPGVIGVVDNSKKLEENTYNPFFNQPKKIEIPKEDFLPPLASFEGKARAFVQIQNGCDHRCTFCIIPYGRGPSKSVPIGGIVDQVQYLLNKGCQEVVLTGVDITAYGLDLPGTPTFGQMIQRLLALVPDLKRLRLSSLDPAELEEDFWEVLKNDTQNRLLPHFHLSLQAGHDLILKRMKRRHLRADIIKFCERIRSIRPGAVFGADIIVGFPTETEEMFEATIDLVKKCNLTFLHVFPYSPRPGTPAVRMPQVTSSIIKDRSKKLRQVGQEQVTLFFQHQLNKETQVLIESCSSDDAYKGKTDHFAPMVICSQKRLEIGEIYSVVIKGYNHQSLIGEVIEK